MIEPESDALDRFLRAKTFDVPPSADAMRTKDWRAWGRMEIALMTCYAGSVACARHRKRTVVACLASYGRADAERAQEISEAHFAMQEPFGHSAAFCRESALEYATSLVRSRQGWAAVSSLAVALREGGRLQAEDVDALCYAAFGARPLVLGWDPHWPPDFYGLEQGYMPQADWPWYLADDFYDLDGTLVPPLPNPYREDAIAH